MPLLRDVKIRTAAPVCLLSLALASSALAATPPGKLRAAKSATGAYATATASATIRRPRGMWVRLIGGAPTGNSVVICSIGSSNIVNHYQYRRGGTYRLPVQPAKADRCQVIANGGGTAQIRVEIRSS
jgi:hypothetical protein